MCTKILYKSNYKKLSRILKIDAKPRAKTIRTIKVYRFCEQCFILNHCKNPFKKSLVKTQKSYKNVQ